MLIEQSPLVIELDVPAIRYSPNGFVDGRVDAHELTNSVSALGAICPECSYPLDGRCTWCPDDPAASANIPECHRCRGHEKEPEPWYKRSELLVPALISAAVTVTATVVSTIVLDRMRKKKRK